MGQGGAKLPERSDSSGLLNPASEPWTQQAPNLSDIGSPLGTEHGGAGLTDPTQSLLQTPSGDNTQMPNMGGLGGMPMMPGMGAPATDKSREERSDSSGLLSSATEPWSDGGAEILSDAGAANGTDSGGPGLTYSDSATLPSGRSEPSERPEHLGTSADWLAASGLSKSVASERTGQGRDPATRTSAQLYETEEAWAEDPETAAAEEAVELDRVPVVAESGAPDDPSAWEVAGAAASFLGVWVTGRLTAPPEEDEILVPTLSTEQEAWIDELPDEPAHYAETGSGSPRPDDETEPGLATWRRAKSTPGRDGGTSRGPELRSGLPAPNESTGEAQEPDMDESSDDLADDDGSDGETTRSAVAHLLVQKRSTWATDTHDWGDLG
jgi:hypothetical protein